MKKRLKITEGKAVVKTFDKYGKPPASYWLNIGEHSIFSESPCKKSDMELIADAFNTANETQLLPSELKKQRDVLLAAVKINADIFNKYKKNKALTDNHRGELYSAELKLSELINKIKDNE